MKILNDQIVSTETLRAIADMVDAGAITDFAVVAIMSNGLPAMDFLQPPREPQRMIDLLNEMGGLFGNKEKHEITVKTIAEWRDKGLVGPDGAVDFEKLEAMEGGDAEEV